MSDYGHLSAQPDSPFETLNGLMGQRITALSTTSDEDTLLGFHLLGEDGYAVTIKGTDLTVETYQGWKIGV